jgi:ABC-type sugar transport system ATPase subunit
LTGSTLVTDARPPAGDAIIAARGLRKSFGATRALVDGTLSVSAGEIVALLGENGSGKSTLVKLLSGALAPDGGELFVGGRRTRLTSPRAGIDHGCTTVFQEILVAPDRSLLDNIWLGSGSARRTARQHERRVRLATEVWSSLSDRVADFSVPAGQLPLTTQQLCVIVRALLRKPALLILDESTSTLDVALRDRLFGVLRERVAQGMGCLFISHRMDEVLSLADRFVTMRNGEITGERARGSADAADLIRLVSGDQAVVAPPPYAARAATSQRPVVRLADLVLRPGSSAFSAQVRQGEVVGLAGLEGHGQEELLLALAGLGSVAGGSVQVAGRDEELPTAVGSYGDCVARGIVYVPRDRKVDGIAAARPIVDNYAMPTYREDRRFGVLRPASTLRRLRRDAAQVNLAGRPGHSVSTLSGGNQQKVILARWLAARPGVVLLNDPTRGVDIRTKHELYDVFRRLAEEGTTVVLLSSEVEELLHLVDRVLVFHAGSLSAELSGSALTAERLVGAYFGVADRGGDRTDLEVGHA